MKIENAIFIVKLAVVVSAALVILISGIYNACTMRERVEQRRELLRLKESINELRRDFQDDSLRMDTLQVADSVED